MKNRKKDILMKIKEMNESGEMPSCMEMAKELGLAYKTVNDWVLELEGQGKVRRFEKTTEEGSEKEIEITEEGEEVLGEIEPAQYEKVLEGMPEGEWLSIPEIKRVTEMDGRKVGQHVCYLYRKGLVERKPLPGRKIHRYKKGDGKDG